MFCWSNKEKEKHAGSGRRVFSIESTPSQKQMERTLVIIKGDAIARSIVGKIIMHLEENDLKILAIKNISFDAERIKALYGSRIVEASFYPEMLAYLTHGYHLALILQGVDAIGRCLVLKGSDPETDKTNTLRKLYAINKTISTIHCSDKKEEAEREMLLFFKPEEIPQSAPTMANYKDIVDNAEHHSHQLRK